MLDAIAVIINVLNAVFSKKIMIKNLLFFPAKCQWLCLVESKSSIKQTESIVVEFINNSVE